MTERLDRILDHPVLGQVLDTIADGVFALDHQGQIIFWSHSMERITGHTAGAAMGRTCGFLGFSDCLGVKGHGNIRQCSVFRGTASGAVECFIRHRDGRDVPVIKNATPVTDSHGRVIGVIEAITDLTELEKARAKAEEAARHLGERHRMGRIIGKSREMSSVFTAIAAAGESRATVLIQGESGTGKELVAGAIHYRSGMAAGPFAVVNCAALSESVLESELFGHARGAFTGAVADRAGRLEAADGGTVFLDEIGELSPLVQVKLLRVLQERVVERMGESRQRRLDIRIITATHRDLGAMVKAGTFREDLYYRLKVFPIRVPPLRARKTDIPLLIQAFMARQNRATGKQVSRVSPQAMQRLMDHDWPGNVRELENAVEHAFVLCRGRTISPAHLPIELRENRTTGRLPDQEPAQGPSRPTITPDRHHAGRSRARLTRASLLERLRACNWNKAEAARQLGVSRTAVWKRMKQWEIPLARPDRHPGPGQNRDRVWDQDRDQF